MHFKMSSAICFNLDQSKILSSGNGLNMTLLVLSFQVATIIEDGLKIAREKVLKCEVLIPCGLTKRIARDILIMSESEPCGVRGCSLVLHLQEKSDIIDLGKVQCDPNTVSTFEIHLTIQEDTRSWVAVKKMVLTVTGCFKNSVFKSSPKMMGLGYKLEKLKLYRTSC